MLEAGELAFEVGVDRGVRADRQFGAGLDLRRVAARSRAVDEERRARQRHELPVFLPVRRELVDIGRLQRRREDHAAADVGHPLQPGADEGRDGGLALAALVEDEIAGACHRILGEAVRPQIRDLKRDEGRQHSAEAEEVAAELEPRAELVRVEIAVLGLRAEAAEPIHVARAAVGVIGEGGRRGAVEIAEGGQIVEGDLPARRRAERAAIGDAEGAVGAADRDADQIVWRQLVVDAERAAVERVVLRRRAGGKRVAVDVVDAAVAGRPGAPAAQRHEGHDRLRLARRQVGQLADRRALIVVEAEVQVARQPVAERDGIAGLAGAVERRLVEDRRGEQFARLEAEVLRRGIAFARQRVERRARLRHGELVQSGEDLAPVIGDDRRVGEATGHRDLVRRRPRGRIVRDPTARRRHDRVGEGERQVDVVGIVGQHGIEERQVCRCRQRRERADAARGGGQDRVAHRVIGAGAGEHVDAGAVQKSHARDDGAIRRRRVDAHLVGRRRIEAQRAGDVLQHVADRRAGQRRLEDRGAGDVDAAVDRAGPADIVGTAGEDDAVGPRDAIGRETAGDRAGIVDGEVRADDADAADAVRRAGGGNGEEGLGGGAPATVLTCTQGLDVAALDDAAGRVVDRRVGRDDAGAAVARQAAERIHDAVAASDHPGIVDRGTCTGDQTGTAATSGSVCAAFAVTTQAAPATGDDARGTIVERRIGAKHHTGTAVPASPRIAPVTEPAVAAVTTCDRTRARHDGVCSGDQTGTADATGAAIYTGATFASTAA